MRGQLRRVLFVFGLIAAWSAGASAYGALRPERRFLVPSPGEVARSIVAGTLAGTLPRALLVTLERLALGYGLSLAVGVGLGVVLGRWQAARDTLGAVVLGLQAIPSVCWMPVALLWFGLNERAILMVVVLGSTLSVAIATESAVRNVPPLYVRAARTMGARGLGLYTQVVLPAALPGILAGARLGWTFAWRSLMAAELLFVSGGLGQVLEAGRELYDMAQVVGVMVVIVVVGLLSEYALFSRLEARVRQRWGLDRA